MFAQIWAVMAPVLACAGVGYFWGRTGRPFDMRMVSALVTTVATPCLIVATLGKTGLSLAALSQVAGLFVAIMLLTGLLALAAIRLAGLSPRVFLPSLLFPNTGNMGLSLCLLAFGDHGLALALAWMMLTSVVQFSFGLAVVSGEGLSPRLLAHPILISVVIAVLMVVFQIRLPAWLFNSVDLIGQLTIPMMLVTLGVSLSTLRVRHLGPGAGFALLRLLLGFAIAWSVCALAGIDGLLRGVIVIQSSMPVAVFNYLLAQTYRQGADQVAAMVVISTVLSFLTLPLLLMVTMP
ncbi:AEC family transporter [Alloalcanivorax mobilis]|uniref:AEC family transporter n=1 Tax=Alloalcanivorax mobilis TaxID=2019569 RepID=UPI000B5B44C8|nr:AEC family transporter [Alloalcanivorax mobilis]ASK34197.1 transporter [Alcanivorax sp. N3-2A]|tara:strand:+ start:3736 stop:4614 length:879 start_codon:yes stop_codon:yes gene_type:complete